MKTLHLRCPKCRQTMKYQPRGKLLGKAKKCVYCGCSFTVKRDRIEGHE